MPIDPEAIERFLAREIEPLPAFKGADPDWLRGQILQGTGAAYEHVGFAPRPPQLEGLAAALHLRRALLFYGMRMGKTKIGLDWAAHLRKAGLWRGKGFIVAHAPVGVNVWVKEAKAQTKLKVRGVLSGPKAGEQLETCLNDNTDLVVIAWSTLQALFTHKKVNRRGVSKLVPNKEMLAEAAAQFSLCIFDEIHTCQNAESLRFSIAEKLVTNCDYRLGLTGTPSGRNPFSTWAQVYLIDEGELLGRSFFFFKHVFGKEVLVPRHGGGLVEDYVFDKKKMPLLEQLLSSISISYELGDTQKLDVRPGIVTLTLSPAQQQAYDEQLAKAEAARNDEDMAPENVYVRLRQISAGFLPFVDNEGTQRIVKFPGASKLAWLAEFLDNYDSSYQMLIFHEFTPSGRHISALLTDRGINFRWLWGGAKDKNEIIRDFQKGRARVLLANTAAGSMAIDLPQADYLLFFDSPACPKIRAQAEARPMSRGSKPLYIDDLVCSPTDQKVLGFIKEGKNVMHQLAGRGKYGFLRSLRRKY